MNKIQEDQIDILTLWAGMILRHSELNEVKIWVRCSEHTKTRETIVGARVKLPAAEGGWKSLEVTHEMHRDHEDQHVNDDDALTKLATVFEGKAVELVTMVAEYAEYEKLYMKYRRE